MPVSIPVAIRKAAERSTPEFDWLLGDRQFFTFKAASALTDMSESFLEKLWEDSQHELHIDGHEYNAGKGIRQARRINRAWLVRLLVKSARYDADQKREAVLSLVREFNAADCRAIGDAFMRAADRK